MNRKKRVVAAFLASFAIVGASQAGLVAEWNFDDQTLANSGASTGLHDGSYVSGSSASPVAGTAVFTTNTPSGTGYALDLSSVSNYMMIANSSTNDVAYTNTFDSATNYSYSIWVKNPTNTWNGYGSIIAKGFEAWKQDDALKVGFELRAHNFLTAPEGVRVDAWGSTGASVRDPAPYTDLTDGVWHHLTYTYDGTSSNLNLYIDGSLRATGTNMVIRPAPGNLMLFGAVEGEEEVKQSDLICDTIQFYDHALSESEAVGLYIQQTAFYVDPGAIAFETAPGTLVVTSSVDVAYLSGTNVEVNVSFSNVTHAGAFSVVETQPLVLTNPFPAMTPINIAVDAGTVINGEIVACTAVIAWNEQGSTEVTEVKVPVTITITNYLPTADPVDVTTAQNTDADLTLSGSDPEGSNLTYTVVTQPANGTLTTNGALPNLTYHPDADFSGQDSFTYTVNDGDLDSAPATVTITVMSPSLSVTIQELGTAPEEVNPVNLSTNGPTDWVMLGRGGDISVRDEMAGSDYIGAVTVIGERTGAYGANPYLCSWTNGATVVSTNDVQGSWEGQGASGELSFAVTNLAAGDYSMDVYCSRWRATGQLTASIGAASASAAHTEGAVNGGAYYAVYTVDFTIETGDVLDVLVETTQQGHTYGNVSITAIALEMTSELVDPVPGDVSIAILYGTNMVMSWETAAGYKYGIEATDNLVSGTWTNIVENLDGTGGDLIITNAIPDDEPQLFFRSYLQD
ncbi:hypothetical protein PDESU_01573 [Pontiella desulfatans]|uniref:LamG-like jellyroll fold domain-containing protein n=1 Tax=Pontiella desulfatans TaxID=2750659 RepID=A0A6C2TZM3_PONDE|nr:Ig-like domain-containing protein [Pontiella desulfatans]VGO13019.1 hypothetical protein PDESU_01573 [Pontiella desulfatans]